MKPKSKSLKQKSNVSIKSLAKHLGYEINSEGKIFSIFKNENVASLQLYEDTATFYCFSTDNYGDYIDLYLEKHKTEATPGSRKKAKEIIDGLVEQGLVKTCLSPSTSNSGSMNYHIWPDEHKLYHTTRKYLEDNTPLKSEEIDVRAFEHISHKRRRIQSKIYADLKNYCEKSTMPSKVMDYLLGEDRKFTANTIKNSGIFYISDVKATINYLKLRYSDSELEKSGLFKNSYFVLTKHPLVFPHFDSNGIVYLTGRIFPSKNNDSSSLSKYKGLSNVAGNLSRKRFYNTVILKSLKPGDKLLICEGEPDTLIAIQWGLKAIGIPGINNFPIDMVDKLREFDIHFCFDSDQIAQETVQKLAALFNRDIKNVVIRGHKDLTEVYDPKYKSIYDCPHISITTIKHKSIRLISSDTLEDFIHENEGEPIVPGLIYIGYTILAGFNKTGKSMLALDLSVALARGYKALGYFYTPDKCSVLYMAYEDNMKRIKERLNKMVEKTYHKKRPSNLYLLDQSQLPQMNDAGIKLLQEALAEYPEVRVIIIDTYAASTDDGDAENPYNYKRDSHIGRLIQQFAMQNNIAVIVVHHLKKKPEKYRMNAITGTTGILASADSVIMLNHEKENRYSLYVKGRDTGETEYLIMTKNDNHKWRIIGDNRWASLSNNALKVLSAFKHDPDLFLKSKTIADNLKMHQSEVCDQLTSLVKSGILKKNDDSTYQLVKSQQE